jgi:hypothetical protein
MSYFLQTVATQKAAAKDLPVGKFGAKIVTFPNGVKAVLKFKAFANNNFRGVPKQELHRREVAAFRLDRDVLRFHVVPETLIVKRGGREGSMQQFHQGVQARDLVPGIFDRKLPDWKYRIAKLFTLVNVDDLHKIVVFDLIINNADRHARNVIFDTFGNRVWAIDNGLAFGPYFKSYRNVFHKYLYLKNFSLSPKVRDVLEAVTKKELQEALRSFISFAEIEQVWWRIQFLLEHEGKLDFTHLSQGNMEANGFPSYEKWFVRKMAPPPEMSHVIDLAALPGWEG